jgi:3',5'-cyclic-AMP phosphodiesterase
MLIAQISDLHVAGEGSFMRRFVDANAKLAEAVAYVNNLTRRPDVVIATGDLTDHGTEEQYGMLREIIGDLRVPLLMIPGNHDEREPFRSMARAMGHDHVPSDGPVNYVLDEWPVRLVALDSLRDGHHDGELDASRLAWLDAALSAQPDRPTLVFLHHPPFETGIWWMDKIGLTGIPQLREVIGRHPQVVRLLAGHLHRPIVTSWASTVVSCAPSTTHQTRCDLDPDHRPVISAEAPGLELHWWTGDAFVSHTTPFETPERVIDMAALMQDWPAARDRIRQGAPFAKGGAFG